MGSLAIDMVLHPVFGKWCAMINRCYRQSDKRYKNYGGRGIVVCDRWLDFWKFAEDVVPPGGGLTMDRIDVNGDYCPENTRWATFKQQANNKTNNFRVEYKGMHMTADELEAMSPCRVPRCTIISRIKRGWDVESAISTPPKLLRRREYILDGKRVGVREMAESSPAGVSYGTVRKRLSIGWDINKAINAPVTSPGHYDKQWDAQLLVHSMAH